MALLEVIGMGHNFGGLRAVDGFDLTIEGGEIVGLIGPNGAGKTTIFNLITGIYHPTDGRVIFDGKDIVGLKPHQIAARGLARTFQEMRLWRHMSVLDHVKMARYSKLSYGLWGAFFNTGKREREEREATELAHEYLGLFGVDEFADQWVANLPYGVARRVEMARAMATEPKLLFLDEPTVGMTPDELDDMIEVIRQAHERFGLAIFLIEHRLKVVSELCTHVLCLNFGQVITEGTPQQVRNHPKVIEAYLGDDKMVEVVS